MAKTLSQVAIPSYSEVLFLQIACFLDGLQLRVAIPSYSEVLFLQMGSEVEDDKS